MKSLIAKGLAQFMIARSGVPRRAFAPGTDQCKISARGIALVAGGVPFDLVGASQVEHINKDAAELALHISQAGGFAMKIDLRGVR